MMEQRLTLIEFSHKGKRGVSYGRFRCSCGNEHIACIAVVKIGGIRSCGCLLADRNRERQPLLTDQQVREKIEAMSIPEPNTGCWLWTRSRDQKGYGTVGHAGRVFRAHRLSYQVFKGALGDLHVCHRCDTPACVNPDHLFLGTNADNSADRDAKGRLAPKGGDLNGNARLTAEQVKQILEDRRTQKRIAEAYGVSLITIGRIKRGIAWKDLTA